MKKTNLLLLLVMTCALFIPESALASTSIDEFNTPFESFVGVITGPVGKWISIAGMAGVGLALIFNHSEMNNFVKGMLGVVFAICFIAFASPMVNKVFTFSGAIL